MPLIITSGLGNENTTPPAFTLSTIANTGTVLTLTFTSELSLSGPAAIFSNYTISGPATEPPVNILSLSVSGTQLTLGTSLQQNGSTYTLNIPAAGFNCTTAQPYTGTYNPTFTGSANPPTLVMARQVDARTTQVVFSVPVNPDDALNAAKYSITGGVSVLSVVQESAIIFQLTHTHMVTNSSYTVTATGIRDFEGNT